MTRQVWLVTLTLAFGAPGAVAGQDPLTLDAAVNAALSQNTSLRAARAASDEAAAQVTGARSGFFPRVSFTDSWQRGDQPVFVHFQRTEARRFDDHRDTPLRLTHA
jgi:outer membrane protein TolC